MPITQVLAEARKEDNPKLLNDIFRYINMPI